MCIFILFCQKLGDFGTLLKEPRLLLLESALPRQLLCPRAPCAPGGRKAGVLSASPAWGWLCKPRVTFEQGDFGILEQSLVKIAIMPVKGKGHGLKHYPGFCMQKTPALSGAA